jgi:hypothetical protein
MYTQLVFLNSDCDKMHGVFRIKYNGLYLRCIFFSVDIRHPEPSPVLLFNVSVNKPVLSLFCLNTRLVIRSTRCNELKSVRARISDAVCVLKKYIPIHAVCPSFRPIECSASLPLTYLSFFIFLIC